MRDIDVALKVAAPLSAGSSRAESSNGYATDRERVHISRLVEQISAYF